MPNFELFGYGKNRTEYLIENIKAEIAKSDTVSSILDSIIFTIHMTVVKDAKGIYAPFIRLASTPKDELVELIKILQKLNVDVEVMILDEFIPAKSLLNEELDRQ